METPHHNGIFSRVCPGTFPVCALDVTRAGAYDILFVRQVANLGPSAPRAFLLDGKSAILIPQSQPRKTG